MDKAAKKREILASGIKAQEAIVNDFRNRIEELKATGQQYAADQQDSGTQSMTQGNEEQAELMSEQLTMLVEELEKLHRINPNDLHEEVHLGSVVVTEKEKFFVSVSIERFKVAGLEYFGVSTKAPIYKAMEGKRQGETFEVNGRKFSILELY
jgi:transcription elongation GreA/GreB family factor